MKVTKKVKNLEGGMSPPPQVLNFSRKTRHSHHQTPRKQHFTLVTADDDPLGVRLNSLPQTLGKSALAGDMLNSQITHILPEAPIHIPDQ
jgi:hypothetical protein